MDSGGQTVERNLQVQGVLAAGRRWQGTGRLALAIGIENLVGIRLACRAGSRETHYIRSFAGGDGMHVPGAMRGSRRKIGLRESRPRGLVCAGQHDRSEERRVGKEGEYRWGPD